MPDPGSNFFELAVAIAIVLFGFDPEAALATTVGVRVEVPVMLSAVRIVNRSKRWSKRRYPGPAPNPGNPNWSRRCRPCCRADGIDTAPPRQ